MAQRKLARREVTNVEIPQDKTAEGFNNLADTAMGFVDLEKKKDLANMNDFMADANLQMTKTTNDWRIANEADPTNKEALGKLHGGYNQILNQYTDKVGMLSRGTWTQVSNKLKSQYQLDNLQWGQKQTVVNMESRTNDSIDKNLQMFRESGKTFDFNKFKSSYQTSREALESFAVSVAGNTQSDKLLKDYHKDSMKMFIYGAAESDPDKARLLLDRQDVQNDIDSPEDMQTLRGIVDKNILLKQKGRVTAQNGAEDKILTDYLLDSSKVDIITVDKALASGQIRPEFAKSMRNTILSPKTVDAETKDDTFIDFTNRFADLNKKGSKISLEEASQFRNDIINAHGQGTLDSGDAQKFLKDSSKIFDTKLNNQVEGVLNKTNPKSFLQAASFWSDEYAAKKPEVKARMYRGLMDRLRQGQNAHEALGEVIKEEISIGNPNATLSGGTPNNIISANDGIKQGVYQGKSDSKADYTIKNGQVVAKGSVASKQTNTTKERRVGDRFMFKGKERIFVGKYPDGEWQYEDVNAKTQ